MRLIFSSLFLALFMLGCSSPKTSYYKMIANPIAATTAANRGTRIMVGPINIPDSLNRPQLVTLSGATEVQVHEYHRWAGSLKGDIGQVVASKLAQDLRVSDVWSFSQSTQAQFDYQILLDVQRLDSAENGNVVLDVLWTIKPSAQDATGRCKGRALTGRSVISEPIAGSGFDALVAAQSRAFSKVGDDVAKRFTSEGCRP
jgi:uncharacterized lipoprotein YmbA